MWSSTSDLAWLNSFTPKVFTVSCMTDAQASPTLKHRVAEALAAIVIAIVKHVRAVFVSDHRRVSLHPRVPARQRNFDADLLIPARPVDSVRRLGISEPVAFILGPRTVKHAIELAALNSVGTAHTILAAAHVNADVTF